MKLICPVVEDLLPLYQDHMCSTESRKMIEAHLADCPNCRQVLEDLQEDIPYIRKAEQDKVLKSVESSWKEKRWDIIFNFATISAFLGAILLLFLCVQTTVYFSISAKKFEIRELSQLSTGEVVFRVWSKDPGNLDTVYYNTTEQGEHYISFMRKLIHDKDKRPEGLSEEEIQKGIVYLANPGEKLYIGPVGRGTLVWEEGKQLPPASDELEKIGAEKLEEWARAEAEMNDLPAKTEE